MGVKRFGNVLFVVLEETRYICPSIAGDILYKPSHKQVRPYTRREALAGMGGNASQGIGPLR